MNSMEAIASILPIVAEWNVEDLSSRIRASGLEATALLESALPNDLQPNLVKDGVEGFSILRKSATRGHGQQHHLKMHCLPMAR